MLYPKFYDEVEKIEITDELSEILGAFKDGKIEFSYLDIVKSAGHSCPTVAGAYLMLKDGLKRFNNPKRGELKAYLKDDISEGVTGVISNIISQVIGSTSKSGFHGLAGKYDRRGLMYFNADISSSMRLIDRDGKVVDIDYDPSKLLPNPKMNPLMQKVLSNGATKEEKKEFQDLWQERVEKILTSPNVVITIKIA
ncbi:MAG: hypothetical protein JJV95_04540 [Sulfurospirillum sp.]|nr:hypothetical protein [Sulfurospirillum sp.]